MAALTSLRRAGIRRCLATAQLGCLSTEKPAVALGYQTCMSTQFRTVSATCAAFKPKKGTPSWTAPPSVASSQHLLRSGKTAAAPSAAPPAEHDDHAVEAPSLDKFEQRAERVVEWFQEELSKLRGGSASAGMLDSVPVSAYGDTVPLSQLAQVALKQGNTLVVSPFDPSVSVPACKAPALPTPTPLCSCAETSTRLSARQT